MSGRSQSLKSNKTASTPEETIAENQGSDALRKAIARLCQRFEIAALYVFGSRGEEIRRWMEGGQRQKSSPSDVDVGVRPIPGTHLSLQNKVKLAIALEDLFKVGRVDLVSLPEVDPFLAANVIRGERLYARDEYEADEYDLYILRRAGDLAPLERERMALILGEASW